MAVIKVTDIAYARLRAPDLDLQAEFLENFGLVPERTSTNNAIYYRGTDPVHHIHITEKGDPKFVGIAYHAASEDDLKTLAKVPGASGIENLDEPGGGKRVRLTEPNGYQIEVVWGMDKVAGDPGAASGAQLRLRAARPRRRPDAASEGSVARASASRTPCSARRR